MSAEELVLATWFDHDCPWFTKFCDEHHVRTAWVPLAVLKQYEPAPTTSPEVSA